MPQIETTRDIVNDVGTFDFTIRFTDAELDKIFENPANNADFAKLYAQKQWEALSLTERAQLAARLVALAPAEATDLGLKAGPPEPDSGGAS